jgi:hypothetical protein
MTDTNNDPDDSPSVGLDSDLTPSRSRRWVWSVAVAGTLVVVGLGLGLWLSHDSKASATNGPEGVSIEEVPDLAPADTTLSGAPVDGITCRTTFQQKITYHVHAHVAVFVNGQERRIPAGTGIPAPQLAEHLANGLFVDNGVNGCLYWLHVHSNDGVIHVESPYKGVFTLGQFFDIWQQPLGPNEVGPAKGAVVAFDNGKRFNGNPRTIPLLAQSVIQLDVGTPAEPFQQVHFNVNGLCGSGTLNCATPVG